jgi:hypothetical protein
LAAFWLGFGPCKLWFKFCHCEDVAPGDTTERWLRDAPAYLGHSIDSYIAHRFGTTLDEFLGYMREFPAESEGGQLFSARTNQLLLLKTWDLTAHHPGSAMIRLSLALHDLLPAMLRRWFRVGQTLGRYYGCLHREGWDRRFALLKDIDRALAETDLDAEFRPAISRADFLGAGQEDQPSCAFDKQYAEWVPDQIDRFVDELFTFLTDEPHVALNKAHNFLWFMGVDVELTPQQCEILAAIAEAPNERVSREDVLTTVDLIAEPQKVDQYVQHVINKIVSALRQVGPPRYRNSDEETRRWLRDEFLISARGVGYGRGRLMASMQIKP